MGYDSFMIALKKSYGDLEQVLSSKDQRLSTLCLSQLTVLLVYTGHSDILINILDKLN